MLQTPLFDEYARHGAKVIDFNGWALPLQFSGIIAEHQHVRAKAGLFDCSHMGEFLLEGTEAAARLDNLVFVDMRGLRIGRCRYGAILNDSAGIVDDCVALRLDEETLYLVTNAAPIEEVARLLEAPGVTNVTAGTAKIDLQGPASRDILLEIGMEGVASLKYWQGARVAWRGKEIIVTRAGYTGELGYEIFLPNDMAVDLWRTLAAADGAAPAGLGARDTLRLEVGYPLNGEDLAPTKTPLESGMERFIDWEKEFPGKEILRKQHESGEYTRLTAIKSLDRRAPRHGFELKHDGSHVGMVTSGAFGPSVGLGVGLADIAADFAAPGTRLAAGPREAPVVTAEIPIYTGGTCRMRF